MLTIRYSGRFKKDFKHIKRQKDSGYDEEEFRQILVKLSKEEPLDAKYRDHPLYGNYAGARECHIRPDLLLIYEVHDGTLELLLLRMGSHSELFGM